MKPHELFDPMGSKDVAKGAGTDWMKWIAKLSKSEKEEFLVRLAEGESTVGRQLRSRLKEISRKQMSTRSSVPPTHRRRVSEILERKTALGNERTDRERRALKATHARKMKTLATQEADLWREVSQKEITMDDYVLLDNTRKLVNDNHSSPGINNRR